MAAAWAVLACLQAAQTPNVCVSKQDHASRARVGTPASLLHEESPIAGKEEKSLLSGVKLRGTCKCCSSQLPRKDGVLKQQLLSRQQSLPVLSDEFTWNCLKPDPAFPTGREWMASAGPECSKHGISAVVRARGRQCPRAPRQGLDAHSSASSIHNYFNTN